MITAMLMKSEDIQYTCQTSSYDVHITTITHIKYIICYSVKIQSSAQDGMMHSSRNELVWIYDNHGAQASAEQSTPFVKAKLK